MKRILLLLIFLLCLMGQTAIFSQDKREKTNIVEEVNVPELTLINNTLHIENAPIGSHLEVVTIVGNKILDIKIKTSSATCELNLPKGIYIFKLGGVVKKFIVK